MDKIIDYHKNTAKACLRSFNKIDNITHPFTADKLYDNYLFHLNIVKELQRIKRKKT
ncbi:MAG: hypothetical protein Q7R95_11290 [bacterium]|nr:hypothetical protein [bacterium]